LLKGGFSESQELHIKSNMTDSNDSLSLTWVSKNDRF
jgi:hypothetical protein